MILGRNPVAVLSTFFLLSYAKFLRTIIGSFFFTFVEYPGGTEEAVWLVDGNIEYLQGKHIVLFIASLLALFLLFLPYTVLLLLGQWLQKWSEMTVFRWANSRRLKPFLDAYHGPFESNHRYWTGLLLLLRCFLFLTFAFNGSGDPSVNLLTISSTILGLILLVALIKTVYRNQSIQALELSFLLNLGILAAATHHVRLAGGSQAAVVYTSTGVAFVAFVGILFYHSYLQVKGSRMFRKIKSYVCHSQAVTGVQNPEVPNTVDTTSQRSPPVSTTVIELREPLVELLEQKSEQSLGGN